MKIDYLIRAINFKLFLCDLSMSEVGICSGLSLNVSRLFQTMQSNMQNLASKS